MIDTERNPSPEERGFNPSDFKFPDEQEVEEAKQSEPAQYHKENYKGANPNPTLEEQEAITEIEKKVIEGFGIFYDLLPHSGEVDEKKISKILNTIKPLRTMTIPPREAITGAIVHENLHAEEKEDFILELRSIKMVDLWIHMEGLSSGANKSIEELEQNQEYDTSPSF